jgi:hypothetical protein
MSRLTAGRCVNFCFKNVDELLGVLTGNNNNNNGDDVSDRC